MENEELTTFSLEDNPNEEIVEEEFTERDEEYEDDYDDDEDEEEEDYEDDYDDEDYEDEEDYDDGYNDDYYDDRLDKVLDEIAELKRGMSAPSTAVQQPPAIFPPMPQYIYQQTPMGPAPAGSEVVMYNEISRLRDELAKNQSSLEMQKELSRIKDDMARDQRFAESQYNAEIKRLQDRIDDLLKNGESSQGELPPAQSPAAQLESGKNNNEQNTIDFDKLLSINESILRSMRESDSRIQNEIANLRSKVEAMPSAEDINRALTSLKKVTGNGESLSAETLAKLSNDIATLRAAIGENKDNATQSAVAQVVVQGGGDAAGSDINASELLRQLYEIRNALGSSSTAAVNRTQVLLDLVADYRKVSFDVRSQSASLKDKLTSVYNYVKKIEECNEPDAVDLIEATNELIQSIAVQKLDKKSFADLLAYLASNGATIPSQMRDSADKFFGVCEKLAALETLDTIGDYLPDLVAERNALENNRREAQNSKLVAEITAAMLEEKRDVDAIKEKIAKLSDIAIADVAELPLIDMPKNYKPSHAVSDETVFSKLAELKAAFDDLMAQKSAAEEAEGEAQEVQAEEHEQEAEEQDPNAVTLQDIFDAVDELRLALAQATGSDENTDISAMLEEIRNNYIDLSERIVEISDIIVAQNDDKVDDDDNEEVADVLSDEQKLKAIEDLEFIRGRVEEQEGVLNQIGDIRNDILNISGSIDLTEQLATVTSDIAAQFDKLYEDLSNVVIESEANIVSKIVDPSIVIDSVEAAKLDILADTQSIRDSVLAVADGKVDILADTQEIKDTLAIISDSIGGTAVLDAVDGIRNDTQEIKDTLSVVSASVGGTAVLDAVDGLHNDTQQIQDTLAIISDAVGGTAVLDAIDGIRADLSAFADMTAANTDVSNADRQKLLDDVAFLRSRAELILQRPAAAVVTENEDGGSVPQDSDRIYAYLDELTNRVAMLINVPDDVAVTKDTLNVVAEDVVAAKDSISAVAEDVVAAKDSISAAVEDIAVAKDSISAVAEDIAFAKDSVTLVSDSVNTLNDSVNSLTQNVNAVADTVRPIADDVATTRDAAVSTLDALAPISDQLNAILDRLDSEVGAADDAHDADAGEVEDERLIEDLTEIKDNLNTILDTLPLLPQSDDLVTARDNTYSILDTLTMMPQNDDVIVTRDNVAAVLDGINALTESVKGIVDTQQDNAALADDLAVVIDNTGAMLDSMASLAQTQEDVAALRDAVESGYAATALEGDIQFIRQKLEEPLDSDSVADVIQDLGLVLDKLEAFEQSAVTDKQDIIDAISGIREEVHISELNGNIAASGMDDGTRDILVNEISEIRERLGNIENNTNSASGVDGAALDNISAQLADIQNALATRQSVDTLATATEGIDADSVNAILVELADIKDRLEGGVTVTGAEAGVGVASGENLQAIADELAVIREKIDAESEYDTIEEILSLREDIKASRIVDQNEVSGELESIKNELATISSGNILDEIRALRDDIASVSLGGEDAPAPTNDELNLVLNEIVSLRDEMFAFKDEVLTATAVQNATESVERSDSNDEDVTIILDELTALRADQTALTDNIDELKDIISRRTTIATDSDEQQEAVATASNELNVVLGEIIDIKNNIERVEESLTTDRLDALTEQVEEIRTLIDELRAGTAQSAEASTAVDDVPSSIADEIVELRDLIDELRDGVAESTEAVQSSANVDDGASYGIADDIAELRALIDELRAGAAGSAETVQSYTSVDDGVQSGIADDIAELRAEISLLRSENEALRRENADMVTNGLNELRDAIRDMALSSAPTVDASGDTSYAALIDEIRSLKAEVAESKAVAQPVGLDEETIQSIKDALGAQTETSTPISDELNEIRDEIAQLRSLTTLSAENSGAVEIAAIKDELEQLRNTLSLPDSFGDIAEDVTSIKADVQSIKEEPDLGVLNEILALRDEFQKLREEIEDVKSIAGKTDEQSDEAILNEVQSLRDQLFAISMANVNDSESGESNYESYNNLILDELASLREQAATAGSEEEIKAVTAEIQDIKATLENREDLYDALARRVEKIDSDATNNKILEELASLRTELANQRDADLTTLNFMSEMAHLLERQNNYISQNAGSKISDEIESLKAEIASTDAVADAVAEEIAKLRDVMTRSGNASDNDTILNELAELREELSAEKPSKENELILEEIARLRDELITLKDREQVQEHSDSDLKDTLTDLKYQLNEIAEIVEPAAEKSEKAEKPATRSSSNSSKSSSATKSSSTTKKTTTKKSTSTTKRGKSTSKSSGSKSGTSTKKSTTKKPAAKRTTNKAATPTTTIIEQQTIDVVPYDHQQQVERDEVDFDLKLGDEIAKLTGNSGDLSLNPQVTVSSDSMDVADKLAKQVANKLVMEQLVEQLGDGGVSDERVDEILRDILPQEFTTVALNEQSDKVRKLANRLVLNKLRDRLGGRILDDDDDDDDFNN